MPKNAYLSWLKDKDLFKAIKHVCDKYKAALDAQTLKDFTSNVIDPFTFVFDVSLTEKHPKEWVMEESARQLQKSLSNAVGEFHQIILGSCNDWEDLGIGNDSHLDLRKKDGTVYAEIKNKYNTMNSSSTESVFNKLKQVAQTPPYPDAYLVQIVRQSKQPYDKIWGYKKNKTSQIKIVSGENFYAKVTNQPNSLWELYQILPKAIKEFISQEKSSIKAAENSLWEQIEEQIGKKNLSSSDLVAYFFNLAYPNFVSNNVRQLSSLIEDEKKYKELEIDDEADESNSS